ncbi:MAG: VOC family protein [Candidatus Limnocylindria bacterium]
MTEDPASIRSRIRSVVPYLIVAGGADAIDFYRAAFGAAELMRWAGDDGRISHAEIRIGASTIMLADEFPEADEGIAGPLTVGGSPVIMDLEVDDVEEVFNRAIAAGARQVRPVDHPASGVQSAKVVDPFGHVWLITRSLEERRAAG